MPGVKAILPTLRRRLSTGDIFKPARKLVKLSLHIRKDFITRVASKNVWVILAPSNGLIAIMNWFQKVSLNEMSGKVLTSQLKFLNGKVHDILPVWEREKRDNRFDVKPIIMQEDKCIFSPVVMKQLAISWKSGFLDWYLPFEIGLENVKSVLEKWKKRYEDQMVQDIAGLFSKARFDPVSTEVN